MRDSAVLLADGAGLSLLQQAVRDAGVDVRVSAARNLDELNAATKATGARPLLLSFGTSVIVPKSILDVFSGAAVNFHAASPDYPGRDPHHFAIYENAATYGATAHRMTEKVDDGEIIGVERFDVPAGIAPTALLAMANAAAGRLIGRLMPQLLKDEPLAASGLHWGHKRSRKDFLDLCTVPPYVDATELERRIKFAETPGYRNLHIDLHGYRFSFDGEAADQSDPDKWRGFTEAAYAEIIDTARSRYRFDTFSGQKEGAHVLWRHDVDFSVHRAARLAEIERDKGATSTFFFMLNSAFYDFLDPDVRSRAMRILALGHRPGLHFNPDAYPGEHWTEAALKRRMAEERARLSEILNCGIEAVSFHNPDATALPLPTDDVLEGMTNAYGLTLREQYGYCSDSNGYWRFRPLPDVLRSGEHERLQVLTHPAWWTPEPMSPRARVERCVMGRAAAVMRDYDALLHRAGRRNIAR
jgi:folate-dependent phosphoribosylglycinamide formyltransferase PurN